MMDENSMVVDPSDHNSIDVYNYTDPYSGVLDVEYVPTKIRKLDQVLQGGLRKRELGLVLARYQHGKTATLTVFGSRAYIAGRTVLHLVYEDFIGDIYTSYDNILKDKKLNKSNVPGKLFIVDSMSHAVNLPELEGLVQEYNPDLVIVDYADIMPAPQRRGAERFEYRDIFVGLRRIAHRNNCAVWTGTQATIVQDRNGREVNTMGPHRISEDKVGKAGTSDVILGIAPQPEVPHRITCTVIKSKHRPKPQPDVFDLGVDFAVPKFWSLG